MLRVSSHPRESSVEQCSKSPTNACRPFVSSLFCRVHSPQAAVCKPHVVVFCRLLVLVAAVEGKSSVPRTVVLTMGFCSSLSTSWGPNIRATHRHRVAGGERHNYAPPSTRVGHVAQGDPFLKWLGHARALRACKVVHTQQHDTMNLVDTT